MRGVERTWSRERKHREKMERGTEEKTEADTGEKSEETEEQ